MKVSRLWLQNFFDAPLPDAEALAEALTFHAFEIDGIEKVGKDDVLDVKVTPNRGHDCLSHRGIAKELSAILKLPIKNDLLREAAMLEPNTDTVLVTVDDAQLCPRFTGAYIRGVKVGPSPTWLRERLEAVGQRSINNVVDASNYLMFDMGQPSHAFDLGRLTKKDAYALRVRLAHAGERLIGLDNKEYELTTSMLAIEDVNAGEVVSVAGIKGGKATGIDESTTDIFLEAANWDGVIIRKTSQALRLRTDASQRFEQVMSPEVAAHGMKALVALILELVGGELVGFVDIYPRPQQEKRVSVSVDNINKVLGTQLTSAEVSDAFQRLGFSYKEEGGVFEVVVPFERLDLKIPDDLIEEVARIVGYDKIPATPLPPAQTKTEVNKNFAAAEKAREELMQQGYSEVYTSVFADKGERVVLNKVDGVRPYLRDSLLPALQEALKKNIPNKDLLGLKEIKLFEIGTIWKNGKEMMMVGTISEKEKAEEKPLEPLDAAQYDELPLSTAARYQSFSKYPYIVRDVSLWLPQGQTQFGTLEFTDVIDPALAGSNLSIGIHFLDNFQKGEKISFAFRLTFQSFEKTLTEIEVNAIMEKVYAVLKEKGFEIR